MCTLIVTIFFLLTVHTSGPVLAVWADLDEGQIRQAVQYGKRFKNYDNDRFLREWTTYLKNGDKIGVYTKFNLLAIAARDAAKESRELRSEEITAILGEAENKLVFKIILYGNTPEFAKRFHAVLHYRDRYIQPTHKLNPPAEPSGWWPMAPSVFRARCSYDFPLDVIDPDSGVSLIIISPRGGEREFFFDLSRMR